MRTKGAVSTVNVKLSDLISKLNPNQNVPISIKFARTLGFEYEISPKILKYMINTTNPPKVQVTLLDFEKDN